MNKITLTPIFLLFFVSYLGAQIGVPQEATPEERKGIAPEFPQLKAAGDSCGAEPNKYLYHKFSNLSFFNVGNDASGAWYSHTAQYFDAPQPMTISGVGFAAFAQGTPSVDAIVQIHSTNPDSSGNTLMTSDTVSVNQGSLTASGLVTDYYQATFDAPATVTDPYLVVVKNETADTLSVYASGSGDGNGEYLALQYYNNPSFPSFQGWYHFSSFDRDYAFSPVVDYEASEETEILSAMPFCDSSQFCIDYRQKPVFQNNMYSQRSGSDSLDQIKLNWGDGLEINDVSLACHNYTDTGWINLQLTDTLFQYDNPGTQRTCVVNIDTAIYIQPDPIADFGWEVTNPTPEVAFTDSSDYADNWMWDFDDNSTSTQQNPTHIYNSLDSFNVVLTVSNVCDTSSDSTIINLIGVNTANYQDLAFEMYPNPAQEVVNLSGTEEIEQIKVFNTLGELQAQFSVNASRKNINVADWTKGIYLIELTTKKGQQVTQKLVIEESGKCNFLD